MPPSPVRAGHRRDVDLALAGAQAHLARGAAAVALVRPEAVVPRPGGLRGTTLERVYLGEIVAVRLRLDSGQELWSRRFAGEFPDASIVEVGWEPDSVSILADTP